MKLLKNVINQIGSWYHLCKKPKPGQYKVPSNQRIETEISSANNSIDKEKKEVKDHDIKEHKQDGDSTQKKTTLDVSSQTTSAIETSVISPQRSQENLDLDKILLAEKLVRAVINNDISTLEKITSMTNIHYKDKSGKPPLFYALENRNHKITSFLLGKYADSECLKEFDKKTLLEIFLDFIRANIEHQARLTEGFLKFFDKNIIFRALCEASKVGNADAIRRIGYYTKETYGVDFNPNDIGLDPGYTGPLPLSLAVQNNHVACIEELSSVMNASMKIKIDGKSLLKFSESNPEVMSKLIQRILRLKVFDRIREQEKAGHQIIRKSHFYHDLYFVEGLCTYISRLADFEPKVSNNDDLIFNINYFSHCEAFSSIQKRSKNKQVLVSFKTLTDAVMKLLELRTSMKKASDIEIDKVLEAIWEFTPLKQEYNKKQNAHLSRDKDLKFNQEKDRISKTLLQDIPREISTLDYLPTIQELKTLKLEIEDLIKVNQEINQLPCKKESKEKQRKMHLEENIRNLKTLEVILSQALNIMVTLQEKLNNFEKMYSALKIKILKFLDSHDCNAAEKLLTPIRNFMNKNSEEITHCGVKILFQKLQNLKQVLLQIKSHIEENNAHDRKQARIESVPQEELEMKQKQDEEGQRLMREQSRLKREEQVKSLDIGLRSFSELRTKHLAKISEWESIKPEVLDQIQKAKPKSNPKLKPKSMPMKPKTSSLSDFSLNANLASLDHTSEVKSKYDQEMLLQNGNQYENYITAYERMAGQKSPPQFTLAHHTKLFEKIETLDDISLIKFILDNSPKGDHLQAFKIESYALLLACAKAMHTLKSIGGNNIFPVNMAQKFRNGIYHNHDLFESFRSETILDKIRKMTRSIYTYINSIIIDKNSELMKNRSNANTSLNGRSDHRPIAMPDHNINLSTKEQEILTAINSSLFSKIILSQIPEADRKICFEVMDSCQAELAEFEGMEEDLNPESLNPRILNLAKDFIKARAGSYFACFYDHFYDFNEYQRYKHLRKFRNIGNNIRHNVKKNTSPAIMPGLEPLELTRDRSQEFPRLVSEAQEVKAEMSNLPTGSLSSNNDSLNVSSLTLTSLSTVNHPKKSKKGRDKEKILLFSQGLQFCSDPTRNSNIQPSLQPTTICEELAQTVQALQESQKFNPTT